MGINSTRGQTLGYDQETALGTSGGSYGEIRWNDNDLAWPTTSRVGIANPNIGHAHSADRGDLPIFVEAVRESAGPLSVKVRRSTTATTTPPIGEFFESGGCNVRTTTATTVAVYSSTTSWTLTGTVDDTYGKAGDIILPKLEATHALDEMYYPVLVAAKNAGTEAVTAAMALPCATANSEPIEVMTTIYPRQRPVVSTKTLAFKHLTRGDLSDDGSNDLSYVYTGCALASVDKITLEPGKPIDIKFNFHIGDVDQAAEEIAAETLVDAEKFTIINENCRVEFGAATAAGAIARADGILRKAEIDLGFKTIPRKGFGSGCLNDISGYDAVIETPKLTLTVVLAQDGAINGASFFSDMEGANTKKYIGIVQPTSDLATPALAFYMPNCYLDPDSPPAINTSGDLIEVTATYLATTAGFVSATATGLDADEGYAPWYLGVSGFTS